MPAAASAPTRFHNRLLAAMRHTRRYAFRGQARLAQDAGVTRSAVSRLLAGTRAPSFDLALTLVGLLERELDRPLPLRELFSFDGNYPTPSLCKVVGCAGCLPDEAYGQDDRLRPEYRHLRSGEWTRDGCPQAAETALDPVPDDTS